LPKSVRRELNNLRIISNKHSHLEKEKLIFQFDEVFYANTEFKELENVLYNMFISIRRFSNGYGLIDSKMNYKHKKDELRKVDNYFEVAPLARALAIIVHEDKIACLKPECGGGIIIPETTDVNIDFEYGPFMICEDCGSTLSASLRYKYYMEDKNCENEDKHGNACNNKLKKVIHVRTKKE